MLLEHSFIPIELSFFVFTFLRAHKNKTIAYGRNWNKHSLKKSPSMICKARSNKCMPLENFRRYLISLEDSRKIRRVRKRKTNCAIITSFPFFPLVNSSCWTNFPWSHPCICIFLDLSAPCEKTLCDSSGEKGRTRQINRLISTILSTSTSRSNRKTEQKQN